MDHSSNIVIIGAGVFGLTTALQLSQQGYQNVLVLDKQVPPVPDGSSVDISRNIRIDYADQDYLHLSHQAFLKWSQQEKYKGIFYQTPNFLAAPSSSATSGQDWIASTTAALDKKKLPWINFSSPESAKRDFPALSGKLAGPGFVGYANNAAGWANAQEAIRLLRDECIEAGISFLSGKAGTVVSFDKSPDGTIKRAVTAAGTSVASDNFILAAGAWSSRLINMYNSTLSTAHAIGYLPLTEPEMQKYKGLPVYLNPSTGFYCFPPHPDAKILKMSVHGWGFSRSEDGVDLRSTPPFRTVRQRVNFAPPDAAERLKEGLREIVPELADRPFEKLAICWYTDTPTGDFIMDFHPDHPNLFVIGGGSGHGFKFLPVLGEQTALAFHRKLPPHLAKKWRFRTEYQHDKSVFKGDGSRGGPARREFSGEEKARL